MPVKVQPSPAWIGAHRPLAGVLACHFVEFAIANV